MSPRNCRPIVVIRANLEETIEVDRRIPLPWVGISLGGVELESCVFFQCFIFLSCAMQNTSIRYNENMEKALEKKSEAFLKKVKKSPGDTKPKCPRGPIVDQL